MNSPYVGELGFKSSREKSEALGLSSCGAVGHPKKNVQIMGKQIQKS